MRQTLLRIGFFILCLAAPGGVFAQDLKPLQELSPDFDLTAYAATTDLVRRTFPDNPAMDFEISLPKAWAERSALGQDYGELVRFDGPAFGDVRPYFSFRRLQMNRENSARMELIATMLKSGYVLRSLNEIDDRNVEAMYVVHDKNRDSFAVRTRARVTGDGLLLAEYALPVMVWGDLYDQQTFAIRSFQFLHDPKAPVEKRIERSYFNALRFFYPASWVFAGEEASEDNRVTVTLSNPGDTGLELARMNIGIVSSRSLKDENDRRKFKTDIPEDLRAIRQRYHDAGYDIGASIESRKPDLNLPTGFAVLDVYELRRRLSDYETAKQGDVSHELWLAVFRSSEHPDKTYIAELFTPARGQDVYLWSINTRAFEIVLKSIQ